MKKTCTRGFKSVPLDAAVTGPEELVQLKVVIASLISPINFSDCTKEWEHNRRNVLTPHCRNSLSHVVLAGVCGLSLYFNGSSRRSTPHVLAASFSPASKKCLCFLLFSATGGFPNLYFFIHPGILREKMLIVRMTFVYLDDLTHLLFIKKLL